VTCWPGAWPLTRRQFGLHGMLASVVCCAHALLWVWERAPARNLGLFIHLQVAAGVGWGYGALQGRCGYNTAC
jgi:hypothetical protein